MNHLSQICEIGTDINHNYTMLSGRHGFVSRHFEVISDNSHVCSVLRNSIFTKHNKVITIIIIIIICGGLEIYATGKHSSNSVIWQMVPHTILANYSIL